MLSQKSFIKVELPATVDNLQTWPREGKYEIVGISLDRRPIGIVCHITGGGKVRVITVYEDKPR